MAGLSSVFMRPRALGQLSARDTPVAPGVYRIVAMGGGGGGGGYIEWPGGWESFGGSGSASWGQPVVATCGVASITGGGGGAAGTGNAAGGAGGSTTFTDMRGAVITLATGGVGGSKPPPQETPPSDGGRGFWWKDSGFAGMYRDWGVRMQFASDGYYPTEPGYKQCQYGAYGGSQSPGYFGGVELIFRIG